MAVAFGAYRVSNHSTDHYDAMLSAVNKGCRLIDTSSNYTSGESEKLVAQVLKNAERTPIIVSKVGYVQGDNIDVMQELNSIGQAKEELVKVNDGLWHSIHPDYIRNQVQRSLSRLEVEKIDVYLLHNPEYYFYEENATQDEYYKRIEKALFELEALVSEGLIGSYGISSNNFILSPDDKKVTHIDRVMECAQNVSSNHHLTHIQFPFNMIEIDALESWYDGLSLLNKAKGHDLQVMVNRPLNAFKGEGLVRLANYETTHPLIDESQAQKVFVTAMMLLEKKFKEEEPEESIYNLPLIKQFNDLWNNTSTPDGVDQIYFSHFFPFVARVWGGDLSAKESTPFYDLYDVSLNYARHNMSKMGKDFEEQAIKAGLIEAGDEPLQVRLIEKYLSYQIDYVLVGMKDTRYVDQLEHLF
ncbi:aldo/keto reductase [Halobacteriovorax sp.]|uniref:aldo/keto reductase n=1 Tax=Halobacteriovorax sp. TaxID=2020862 RepID=UPI003566AE15